jgi:hypothetical protein
MCCRWKPQVAHFFIGHLIYFITESLIDNNMVDVLTEIQIHAPLVQVSEYTANPDHAPEWYVNIKSVEWKTDRMLQVGSRITFMAYFLGRRLEYTYEISEFIPHYKLVMRTAERPFPMETTYTWQAIDEHTTQMSLRNKGNPKGFSKLFAPFMKRMMRKANRKDLKLLKKILET